MGFAAKFISGLVGSLIAKAVGLFAVYRAGEKAQQSKDLQATQTTEQEAADAKARVALDHDYAARMRARYTDGQ